MSAIITPIELDFKSASESSNSSGNLASFLSGQTSIRTFESYAFTRSLLTPASAFRFTAPGVDKALRLAIRSGDLATIWANTPGGKQQIATGFVDETDTHLTPDSLEYVLSGRDTLGQLVDNSAVDKNSKIVNVTKLSMGSILGVLIANTRIPPGFKSQQVPNGPMLFQTNIGETKISTLQRYLDYTNCLVWTQPNGQIVLGKPNFSQAISGFLTLKSDGVSQNTLIEGRVRRNVNQAIRQIVTQMQTQDQVDAGKFTINNNDQDMQNVSGVGVGRSVYNIFSYGRGADGANQITQVGNQNGSPNVIGAAISRREIARENMKILDVEAVTQSHLNENGIPYNIDQMYTVQIDDEDVNEDMYVYEVNYELTMEHGMITRMRLCRKGTIVADSAIISGG